MKWLSRFSEVNQNKDMKLGITPTAGELAPLNKWYWGIELLKHPYSMFRGFRPQVNVWCIKITEYGEYGKKNGKFEKTKGFYRTFLCSWGIDFVFRINHHP